MAFKVSTRVSTKLNVSVKTALIYGSLGVAFGALFCAIVLLVTDLLKSDNVYAGKCNGTISTTSQTMCLGDSVQLKAQGGDFYLWAPANGIADVTNPEPKASPGKSSTYTCTIYKTLGTIIDESGRYQLTSETMNGNNKILLQKKAAVEPGHDFIIQFQARTTSYLDRAVMQIQINGKTIGTYNIDYRYSKPFEYIWSNKKEEQAEIGILLKSFDGDGDVIECNKISLKALASVTASASVLIDKHCTECPPPQGIKETVLNSKSIKMSWDKTESGKTVLRFKKVGEKNWMLVKIRSCTYIMEELDPTFDYEIQMMCYCDKKETDSSAWSNIMLLKASDRIIADVIHNTELSYKGVILPILVVPDSLNYVLETSFGVDSPSDEVKVEVWSDKGTKYYSNYVPITNGKVDSRLHFDQSLTAGKYMVRIVDGDKTYMNQFEVQ